MITDPMMTYTWAELRNGMAALGRAVRRQAIRFRGWVQWHTGGRNYARLSIEMYETVARRRARGSA